MKTKLLVFILFCAGVFMCALPSCTHPVACFTVNVPWDSIHVREQVYFSAACSQKAGSYFWQIQSSFDTSGDYDMGFYQTFLDTGAVTISLTVVNGSQTDFASQNFKVIP